MFIGMGSQLLQGQNDSLRILPQVEVLATPLRSSPTGSRIEKWDLQQLKPYNSSSVADLLGRESGVFIKSYGAGSLATSSIRGGGAGHTAVIWNGFSIQSPMLGLLDLALLPAFFADEASLQYGGGSALWGSGAIGGMVSLNNLPGSAGFSLRQEATTGSFGWLGQQAKATYAAGSWSGDTRYFHLEADNNFTYKTTAGKQKRQSNAGLAHQGLMQNFYGAFGQRHQVSAHIWWQNADRQIPPTTTQNRSAAHQADAVLRSALAWKWKKKKTTISARSAYFREAIDYQDSLSGVFDKTRFVTMIGEAEMLWQPSPTQQLQVGANETLVKAFSKNYEKPPEQGQTALFAGYRFSKNKWKVQLNGRQEWLDGKALPFVPSLGLEWAALKWLKLEGNANRNYRFPTLNDRYWNPGGNSRLRPEEGWSQELGLHTRFVQKKSVVSLSSTAFNRNIRNWILWSVNPGENYYSPSNLAQVWSRGLEQRFRFTLCLEDFSLQLAGGYDYILSTNQKNVERPALSAGEQLIYVPEHQAFAAVTLHIGAWTLSYQHRYTGPVSTQTDPLGGYQVGYLFLQKTFTLNPIQGRLFFHLDNAWNASYRAIERRPMPGRYFRAGLSVGFEKNQPASFNQ
ncbi:MAG: TonB-dependent receptor [Saprospiraceae bacterium]